MVAILSPLISGLEKSDWYTQGSLVNLSFSCGGIKLRRTGVRDYVVWQKSCRRYV
jgi:hypothetical protein